MNNFKENLKKGPGPNLTCKKGPGPKLKNSRNYTYSACYNYNRATYFSRNINTDANRR